MGLIRGMARTAVVAGTATAVSNRVSRRQAERWYAEENPPVEDISTQAPVVDADTQMAQLERLGQLKAKGVLTQEEFEAKKQQILGL